MFMVVLQNRFLRQQSSPLPNEQAEQGSARSTEIALFLVRRCTKARQAPALKQ
jgi:hypothetical protein